MATISITELAERCGRSVQTIRRWRRQGRIKPLSPLLKDQFGPDVLVTLGLSEPPRSETLVDRMARAWRSLFKCKP